MHIVVSDSAAARLDAARQFVLDGPAGLRSPDRFGVARRGRRLRAPGRPRPRRDVWPLSLQPDAAGRATRGAAAARDSVCRRPRRSASRRWRRGRCSTRTATGADVFRAGGANARISPRAGPNARRAGAGRWSSRRRLRVLPEAGRDLADLFERFDGQFQAASAVDRAAFLRVATEARGRRGDRASAGGRAPHAARRRRSPTPRNGAFVHALASRAPGRAGDDPRRRRHDPRGARRRWRRRRCSIAASAAGLDRVRRHLFADDGAAAAAIRSTRSSCSRRRAKGARRSRSRAGSCARRAAACRSIAWRSRCARRSTMPACWSTRSSAPACRSYFERGTRRPHPAGRAFLALIACALDDLSARRFAEYLSLGQVPDRHPPAARPPRFRRRATRCSARSASARNSRPRRTGRSNDRLKRPDTPARRAFRAPWKWERLLAESRVVAGQRSVGAPPERADARMRAAAPRARAHRTGVGAGSISSSARSTTSVSSRRSRCRSCGRWPRGRRRRRGPNGWICSTRWRRACCGGRTASCACSRICGRWAPIGPVTLDEAARVLAESAGDHRSRAAAAPLRPRPRRQPRAAARPQLRRRVHPGAGGADVSAETARGSAAARRGARSGSTPGCRCRRTARTWRNCSCGWRSARPSRACTSRFRPWRSAKDGRACRRSTRSKCGAP